jgi:hypothetical protein
MEKPTTRRGILLSGFNMSVNKDSRWQEILDGKREWFVTEQTPAACDLFEVTVVQPLRQLRDEGRVTIEEVSAPTPGRYRVVPYSFERFLTMGLTRTTIDDRFEFKKRRQFFIRSRNETLSVVTMCINNPDRSPVGINR